MPVLTASRVVTPEGVLSPGRVEFSGGRITSVVPTRGTVPDRILVPGWIDLQVNGIDDVDVATADRRGWDRLDGLLAAQGTTTWVPTLITRPVDDYRACLDSIADAARRAGPRPDIAGAHLEGPFLGQRAGAHRPDLVVDPDPRWIEDLPSIVRLVTLGAEGPGVADAIRALRRRGVVAALGHSGATTAEATAAIDAGASMVTHLFNAMSGLHHRTPGLVGAALVDDRVTVSVIADGVHVHPVALDVAFRCKPSGRLVLVTDSIAWRGVPGVGLDADGAPRLDDGTLAGSTLTMDAAVARVVEQVGVPLERAVVAAATTPAAVLGLHDRGALAPGRRADIVALDPVTLRCTATWVEGTQVHG